MTLTMHALLCKRIGFPVDEKVTFEALGRILEKTATTIPFENLSVIRMERKAITKENLIDKVLVRNEGGLCYELNTLLYYFLLEHGFHAIMVKGAVYNVEMQDFEEVGRTHAVILLTHEGKTYLVDTGFGGNLPLRPVPMSGEAVTSPNGEFRVEQMDTEYGDHVLKIKIKHTDKDWRIGYAFDSKHPVQKAAELEEIQTIIAEHEKSPFNKKPLITRLTERGRLTLTEGSFTRWVDGQATKEEIDQETFNELAKRHFGISS
jgi:N-hydroxyarylamine O-acetyltransferase